MARLTDRTAFEGETLTAEFTTDAAATAVAVNFATGKAARNVSATNDGGVWRLEASPADLSGLVGRTRWVAFATVGTRTLVCGNGEIYLKPLVSHYREVVDAVEAAIEAWSTNPQNTITVGEITVSAKTVDDLLRARSFYQQKADADETGDFSAGGPRRVLTSFGR